MSSTPPGPGSGGGRTGPLPSTEPRILLLRAPEAHQSSARSAGPPWVPSGAICLLLWVTTSFAHGRPLDFWPVWVIGPWGIVLGARPPKTRSRSGRSTSPRTAPTVTTESTPSWSWAAEGRSAPGQPWPVCGEQQLSDGRVGQAMGEPVGFRIERLSWMSRTAMPIRQVATARLPGPHFAIGSPSHAMVIPG